VGHPAAWCPQFAPFFSTLARRDGTPLLEPLNHAIQIGIAGAKASCEPVSTALGDFLAIGDHLKLAFPAMRNHGVNTEPLLDEGRETRDLGLVVLSGRAGYYLDLHSVLQSDW